MIIVILGALLGVAAAVLAFALVVFGFRRQPFGVSIVLACVVALIALIALVATLPAWIVTFTGRSTSGELVGHFSFELWMYVLLALPPLTLVTIGVRLAWALGRRR